VSAADPTTDPTTDPAADPIAVVESFWDALYDRDWPRIRSFFGEDSVYWDVPTGPATAARGPEGIEARLRLGLDTLSGYEHQRGAIVAGGDLVVTEHAETWHWETGESVTLPFVSVQRVDGDHIAVWRDYWDYQTLWNAAPAAWHERLLTADLWWLYNASGVV
jgi:limonene-1,2-epoxide hydrolase